MQLKASLIAFVAACITSAAAIDYSGSNYIWTNEGPFGINGNQPPGNRAFRRAAYSPRGKRTVSADILIHADNAYELYVNGVKVGTGNDYRKPNLYHVPLTRGCNIFAVNATNFVDPIPNGAALIAKINIHYTDGTTETIVTDQSWRAFKGVPTGFQNEDFFDGDWPAATVEFTFEGRPSYYQAMTLPADASQF